MQIEQTWLYIYRYRYIQVKLILNRNLKLNLSRKGKMRWGKVFLHWSSSHYRNSVTNINLQDIKTSPLNMQGTLRIKTSSKSWGGIDDGKMPFLPLCVPVGTLEGEQAMQLICGQRNKGDTVIRGCRISGHEDMSTGELTIPQLSYKSWRAYLGPHQLQHSAERALFLARWKEYSCP